MDQTEYDPQSWNLYAYVRNNPLVFTDPNGDARWKLIDGEDFWVGDKNNEYDPQTGLYWNEKTQDWGKRQEYTKPASFFGGFVQGLTWPHVLFQRIPGVETHNTRITDQAIQDNPITGTVGAIAGAAVLSAGTNALVRGSLAAPRPAPRITHPPKFPSHLLPWKRQIEAVLRGKAPLDSLPPQIRQQAADYYVDFARSGAVGRNAEVASKLNYDRARYLRNGGDPPGDIHQFGAKHGYKVEK